MCAYLFTFVFPLKWFELHIFLLKYIHFKLNVFKYSMQLDRRLGQKLRQFILFSMAN